MAASATPHRLALVLRPPPPSSSSLSGDGVFLLSKQRRPPKFGEEEYDSFVDSDLWDLPNCDLSRGSSGSGRFAVNDVGKVDLSLLDVDSALIKALAEVDLEIDDLEGWRYRKSVQEPEFGPGLPITTVFVEGIVVSRIKSLPESCKWLSIRECLEWLLQVKPGADRIGILSVLGVIGDSMPRAKFHVPPTLGYQEYPPGVVNIPMVSKTAPPFSTTNLVVFAPDGSSHDTVEGGFVACGDALIVDPGCKSQHHEELGEIVATLPRKLVVFVTHHHGDHVAGLSVIQRCSPDAIILAHKNTIRRIQKDIGSLHYISLSGDEDVIIGGQPLRVIFAPGHTDGHMALLDISTNSLIVGDHCLGQGSAVLDLDSGGNVADYYNTTYNFMDLSPHAIIPMHGRVNLWPNNLLCGYLRNRRKREGDILKAIEAAMNVRVHVEHLAQLEKLPKGFSMEAFQESVLESVEKMGKFRTN
ncbi:hypothetical protein MLD38_017506 [Melastoma candidum]|uniref:Uncharacterized protein n=1 Tax=Melastoma candidum TaxID=119954 RepID=A0ACB9QSR7_9MYRT|nr:hypothetical protein MLD38_017506 [Melastoma candidum]